MLTDDVENTNGKNQERIYYSLISCGLFPEDQKGCRKGTRGIGDLPYIDQHILNESKTRRKNLATVRIDNKEAYDVVPQIWIIDCLKMYKISSEVIMFFKETMKNWWVELTAGGKNLAEVRIQRGIFQGDALSPLLFVIATMPPNHILRNCSGGYKLTK